MKKHILFFAFLTTLLGPMVNRLSAAHLMGADLTYSCISGLQSEFTLSFYYDCAASTSMPTTFTINASSISCSQSTSFTVNQITVTEVSPVCASQIGQTTCGTGSVPGILEYKYRGNFTLPQSCSDWLFSFSHFARNNAITTVGSPGNLDLYIETRMNSIAAPCNSSPIFLNSPVPFVCQNSFQTYNSAAFDSDGDSLVYSLINARSAANTVLPYLAPYSGTNPIASSPAVTISANTGTIDLAPTTLQVGVMAIKVEEYRNNVLIGSVVRDVQIQVQNCGANTAPVFSPISNLTGGFQPSNFRIEICPGQNISFNISGSDADIANILTMTNNSGIPGATFTTSGTNPITGTFSWSPTIADLGFHSLVLSLEDDGCTFKGRQSLGLEVWVLDGAYAGPDIQTCINGSQAATISAIGGSIFGWSVVSGDMNSMSCASCATQQVLPNQTTTYELLTNFTCGNRDSVTVFVNPVTSLNSKNDTSVCGVNSNVQLFANPTAAGTYTYSWAPTTGLSNSSVSNPVANPSSTTEYIVTTVDQNNCVVKDSVTLTVSGNLLDGSPDQTDEVYCDNGTPVRLYANPVNGDCNLFYVNSIPFSPLSPGATTLTLGDDAVTSVSMGMSFSYFCNTFTQLTISSNGWVSFNTYGAGQSYSADVAMPNTNNPNNIIALAWDDLNPNSGGTITYGLSGTAPNRRFVVTYSNVRHFGSTATVTTQLILYETTNIIEIHNTSIQNDGGSLTQGIEGPGGTIAATIAGRNAQVWTATNDAYRFSPASPSPYTVSWQSPLGTVVGAGDSLDVTPAANTSYYAIITDTGSGCTDTLAPTSYAELNVLAATVDAGPNQAILLGNNANLNSTYSGPLPQPNCTDYIYNNIPYAPYTLSAPTTRNLAVGGTTVSAAIPLGFGFDFYCNTRTQVYFTIGGYLTFTNGAANTNPTTIPLAAVPNNLIAYCWSSLDFMSVSYETQGVAPNRRFVANVSALHWFSTTVSPPAGNPVIVQIVLFESGEIDMHMTRIDASWFSPMTQGVEGPTGTNGVAVTGRNAAVGWSTTNQSLRFEPRPANVTYTWTPAATLNDPTLEDPVATPLVDTWYYLTTDNGSCTMTDSVLVTVQPLPVDLLDFRAEKEGRTSLLRWETVLEVNSDFFSIEHSSNGLHFEEIGKVKATGESGIIQEYSFIDQNPGVGNIYYRLRMVDQDGRFEHSPIVELFFDTYGNAQFVKVHPNPGSGFFHFDFGTDQQGIAHLEVINLAGQQIFLKTEKLDAGRHSISIDLSEFASGVYLYRLQTSEWTTSGKLNLKK